MNNFNKIFEKRLDDLEFIALLSVNKKLFSTKKCIKWQIIHWHANYYVFKSTYNYGAEY